MPIYEFYCRKCNTIFNFFSKRINTRKKPACPKCKKIKLERQMSLFSYTGTAKKDSEYDAIPFDESKMEQAIQMAAKESGNMKEDDPAKAADLLRKMSSLAGLKMGSGMEEALARIESGEDPDRIEAEMGDAIAKEDLFITDKPKTSGSNTGYKPPNRDETLYDL